MIEEQIRQIVKEYAEYKSHIADFVRVYDKRYNLHECYKEEAVKFLQWLTERYCVVERRNVVELYRYADFNDMFNKGVRHSLRCLFNSEIFEKEDEANKDKCFNCGKQAVGVYPLHSADIPARPYCRECLDILELRTLMIKVGLDIDKMPKNPIDYECTYPSAKCPHGAGEFCIGQKCEYMKKVSRTK